MDNGGQISGTQKQASEFNGKSIMKIMDWQELISFFKN